MSYLYIYYLTVKKENKTQSDDELFELLLKENLVNNIGKKEDYDYIKESICTTKDYSPELIKEKFENSKIVKLLKQKTFLMRYMTTWLYSMSINIERIIKDFHIKLDEPLFLRN